MILIMISWTWMSGSDIAEQPGIYGTKGMPAADNVPGARYESVAWTDQHRRFVALRQVSAWTATIKTAY